MATKGRCMCGAVRYEYDGDAAWVAHCHCESCRRNCSAAIVTFVGVPRGNWRFTGAIPKFYESSPGVRRHFCGDCGAPIAYDAESDAKNIHFYAAGHEDPSALKPLRHVFYDEALPWLHVTDDLPKHRTVPGQDGD